jgi:peptide/nickel transport system substrate-binding protein
MVEFNRREALALGGANFLAGLMFGGAANAQAADKLTIAFNVNLPSFDPTVGPSSVNPTIQAIYRSIFDQYIGQNVDLSLAPGLLTKWGWNDDKSKAWMDVREGVVWHDGSPLTPEDVIWSIERAGDPKGGNPVAFVWGSLGNFKVEGSRITADCKNFDPTIFKWMAFLTGYVLPKAYYTKVGAEGFEKKPIGTGPYMVDEYQGNAFLRLKRNDKYWGRSRPTRPSSSSSCPTEPAA